MVDAAQYSQNKVVPHSFRPLDTPIDMIEDFSLGLMSLDESLNLNDKEPADKMFLERENKEAKKRLNTNNYL